MLSALRKAGQITLGNVTLSKNASLISQKQASALLSQQTPNLRFVNSTFLMPGDTRSKDVIYQQERVPNARFFDIDQVADKSVNLPHMLPSLNEWTEHMKRLDIGVNDVVICYDDLTITGACRAWWTFKTFGLEKVWVMNSTLAGWKAEGNPIETGNPKWMDSRNIRSNEDFKFNPNYNLVKNIGDIRNWMKNQEKKFEVIDARSPGRFQGTEPDPRGLRGGHIPGSQNLFFKTLMNEQGSFKDEKDIATIIRQNNFDLSKEICFSCGSGVTASFLYAAFFQVGLQNTAVYDGSWSEWAVDLSNPIAAHNIKETPLQI